MHESLLAMIKSLSMAAVLTSLGIYKGAVVIAIIAALCRMAYSLEGLSIKVLGKFFIMSLSLTMFMVHIGKIRGWDADTVIVVSGATAFLCREVLEGVMTSRDALLKRIIRSSK